MSFSRSGAHGSSSSCSRPHVSTVAQPVDVLYLEKNHVTFEPPDLGLSVFFDECNRDIISLYNAKTQQANSSGTRVVFQSTSNSETLEFSLPVGERVLSTKMNKSRTVLAYQLDRSTIELVNLHKNTTDASSEAPNNNPYCLDDHRYTLSCRTRNSKLLGFIWTCDTKIVIITDISIEYFHVDPSKHRSRHIKSFQSSTNWFVYQPNHDECPSDEFSVLMISTGSIGNSIQPYLFNQGQIFKLERFIVDGNWNGMEKLELFEQSITIAYLYGNVRLLVLQHESLNLKSNGAQILVYTLDHELGVTTKTHTLDLDISGRFAINIVDNLVVAHDQLSKSSFIFDIIIDSTEKSDCPKHFVNIVGGSPIRSPPETEGCKLKMYSIDWVFFQPNFIIDVKLGVLCTLHLDTSAMQSVISDRGLLLSFLALRSGSDQLILSVCNEVVSSSVKLAHSGSKHPKSLHALAEVSSTFEILSRLVISAHELGKVTKTDEKLTQDRPSYRSFVSFNYKYRESIQQDDVYRDVLRQLKNELDKVSIIELYFRTL